MSESVQNEIVPDRVVPRIEARNERNRLIALLPAIITIALVVGAAIGGWFAWQAHRQAQADSAEGNVASKTAIGKKRNEDTPDRTRRLGAEGEEPAATATTTEPRVPAIEEDNRRAKAGRGEQSAQPIAVQGNGNQAAPEAPPRSRYDAPMRFGVAAQGTDPTAQVGQPGL